MTPEPDPPGAPSRGYSNYLLGVLVLVYVFNFLDRQIVSILAERIKADIGATDAQMGFLYGTAFAVFYALFGIPLGRLADMWDRKKLIAIGLTFWSMMTALSGLAQNFTQLAIARIGVGVGEASATPAAFSMLSDSFPAARRATALAIYSSGIYIGAGLGLGIGGVIVDQWDSAYAGAAAPFGLAGWQVAFMAVGLPGLLLAVWVSTLREPVRGLMDGIPAPVVERPFREFFREILSVVPPLTLVHLAVERYGVRAIGMNLVVAAAVSLMVVLLTALLGTPEQWAALAIGVYATFSWGQALRRRDAPAFTLIFTTPALRWAALGFAFLAFTGYGTGFWASPFLIRVHGATEAEVGLLFGSGSALGGWLGVTMGGVLADRFRAMSPNGRIWVGLLTAVTPLPIAFWMFTTESVTIVYLLGVPLSTFTAMWIGPAASTVQDLVLPRMRGAASGAYLLILTFIGLALGPYTIGRLSVAFDDLGLAILVSLGSNVIAAGFLLLAMRSLSRDEASRMERAQAAGEPAQA
ncbi:MAG: MFS transporter [Candidatus Binatia bacterium]|nr:MFS transporter [Candidatus Binatia bacterium]